MTDPGPRTRRQDPERRERIIAACLDVIAESGVAGTSHRRVAAAADVPLGSMTYHFSGMDELLREAFGRFSAAMAGYFEQRMAEVRDRDQAKLELVSLIAAGDSYSRRDLVITHELYTLAAREPAFRELTNAWMARSRTALERHFDPATARMLDALIEGLTIHRALDTEPQDRTIVTAAIDRITQGPTG
ncbi:TetR/AcrR family transcriptional regulator [Glycomyces buryatensis]|uniref:TetR family transcriptional regulator n=1 Tax=Glycomyces buryatensis TaxID=2570927 RepID=A0A4S8QAM6_9ACTN|nr:TetR family transcriptional regulator [Glycomyces buryatensis]THV40551.1 TetR family transcriptional regulator [Glycomyces buryatensis]